MITIFKKQWHRILSVILAVAMVVNVTPIGALNAYAEDSISGMGTVSLIDSVDSTYIVPDGTKVTVTMADGETVSALSNAGICTFEVSYSDTIDRVVVEATSAYEGVVEDITDVVAGPIDINVNVTPKQMNVTFDGAGYGEFTDTNVVGGKVYYGRNVTFKFTPNGYADVKFKYNGTSVADPVGGVYTISNVKENITVAAAGGRDISAPVFTAGPSADNTSFAQSREITFATNDSSATYYVSTVNNLTDFTGLTPVTSPCTVTANGTYYIYAVDAAGNVASAGVSVEKVDTEAPVITRIAADPAEVTKGDVNIWGVFRSYDAEPDRFVYSTTNYDVATQADDIKALTTEADWMETEFGFTVTAAAGESNTSTYYVWAIDKAGNVSAPASVQVNIDKASPVFTVTATDGTNVYATDTWTTADSVVISAASDETTAKFKYGTSNVVDDATDYTVPVEVTATADAEEVKKYYFWAVDELGNISANPTEFVVKFDKKAGKVESAAANHTDWTADEVTVSGTVSDAGSGAVKVLYSNTNDASTANEATLTGNAYTFTVPNTATVNDTYYVWVVDNVGNVSEAATVAVKIDKTAPTAGTPVTNSLTWTNIPVLVSGTAADAESGIEKVVYNTTDDFATANEALLVGNNYSFLVPNTAEFNGSYYIWAVDKVGNVSGKSTAAVKIDITAPNAGTPVAAPAGWTNQNVTVSGTATDGVKVEKIVYSVSEMTAAEVLAATENVVANTGEANFAYSFTVENTTEFNGKYYIYAVDTAENVSEKAEVEVKVDTTVPTVDTIATFVGSTEKDFAQTNVWTNQNVTVSGTVSDDDSLIANSGAVKVVYNSTDDYAAAEEAVLSGSEYTFVVPNTTEFNGTYYVWAVDAAGNVSAAKTIAVKIDTTAPAVTDMLHDTTSIISSGTVEYYYFNAAMDVSVTYEDTNADTTLISGVEKLEYSVDQSTWVPAADLTAEYSLTELNKHHTVWARVTDYAGNVSDEARTKVIVLDDQKPVDGSATAADTTKPVIQIVHSGTKTNDIYSGDVTLDISIMDPILVGGVMADYDGTTALADGVLSGLKTVYYEVTTTDTTAKEESDTLLASGTKVVYGEGDFIHKWTDTLTVSSATFNSNNVVVKVWAEDNAGNVSEVASTTFKIDITKPVVSVTYDNNNVVNGKYFQADRTATITVTERNFDAENTKFTISGAVNTIAAANWTKTAGTGNGDDTTWTAKVPFTAEVDYTFNITEVTDLAGNKASSVTYTGEAVNAFTIDKTNPVIEVSYDNNSVANVKYFASSRTATVSIRERNFNANMVETKITAALNGAGIAAPSFTWVSSGDTHTATISYSADGDYTFDINVTDLAGRKNNGVGYGSSVAPTDFTVDKTIEKPLITGVSNGVAYKETVAPAISFNDINYDSHTIRLLRTRLGERNADVTAELLGAAAVSAQGFTLTAANFEEIRENDGIYTLTVTATDRAGNEEMETVTFTVNRFGSVYVYDDYLADLIADGGKYVKDIEGNIIITEYNPDRLVENSLIIEVTRDGKPVDAEFTVSPEINEYVSVGDSGWFQYRYVIDKENFASDGIYKISVSSQDATGNYPELANFEDMDILFRVDSTTPEITSVIGLEESIVNAQELEVKYTLFDAIALKSVKIYLGGNLAEEITAFDDLNNYEGKFVITEDNSKQSVRIVVEDMAGNIIDTGAEDFVSAYVFNPEVTVSTNIFVRWYANKPLFFGSIGGVCAAAAAAWYFIVFKRKKEE